MPTSTLVLFALAGGIAGAVACVVPEPPPVRGTFTETFERSQIGNNYKPTSEAYEINNGVLTVQGAYNHPLWLRKQLPQNVQIEFETWANSADGDLKVEIFGDGRSHAKHRGAYTSTGYVLCMGGWNNSKSFIARRNEHGQEIKTRTQPKVVKNQHYKWRIIARNGQIDWFVDEMTTPFLSYVDPTPLRGDAHTYFGFNNWQSQARFDNLTITAL